MSLSISDIAKEISWDNEGRIFLVPKSLEYQLLTDYLNDINRSDIEHEILQLTSFEEIRILSNKKLIENYIVNHLYGFNEYSDGFYCKIGGFDDFSIMVLYDLEKDKTFLRHNYGQEKIIFSINTLIYLLEKISLLNESIT